MLLDGFYLSRGWALIAKDQDQNGDVRLIQLADVGDGVYRDKSDRFMTKAKTEVNTSTSLPLRLERSSQCFDVRRAQSEHPASWPHKTHYAIDTQTAASLAPILLAPIPARCVPVSDVRQARRSARVSPEDTPSPCSNPKLRIVYS